MSTADALAELPGVLKETPVKIDPPPSTEPKTTPEAPVIHAQESPPVTPPTPQPPALPPAPTEPQPKVQNMPFVALYHDEHKELRMLIAGDGKGNWCFPKENEVAQDQARLIHWREAGYHFASHVGHDKPKVDVATHAVFAWVSVDLAKTIMGSQFDATISKEIQTVREEALKREQGPLKPIASLDVANVNAASLLRPAETHLASCTGCHSCKPDTHPSTAVVADDALHDGVRQPTKAMFAHTTHIGAIRE